MNELRILIKILYEEWWAETYNKKLIDDDSFNDDSLLVSKDTKKKIKVWLRKMKLG